MSLDRLSGRRARKSRRTRRVLAAAVAALGLAVLPEACSPSNDAVGLGGDCALTNECEPGLVCVPAKGGTRICSNDPSGINKPVPVPGRNEAGMLVTEDGQVIDAPFTPPDDDATVTPPTKKDVDQPPVDSGSDTGTPIVDASSDG